MPKVSDAHRAARRMEITEAALRCFAIKGFQRTSMADIIDEAGLSAGAIYGYFAGKRDIALAVAERVLTTRVADIAEAAASADVPSPGAMLRQTVADVSDELLGPRLVVQIWGEATTEPELHSLVDEVFARLRAAWAGYLKAWALSGGRVDEAQAAAWATRTTPLLLALAQGYFIQFALLAAFDSGAYFARVDELFVRP